MSEVKVADLQAIGDVLDWVCEQSDSMDVPTAMEMIAELTALKAKLAMAISLCETQVKTTLDGQPMKVGDKVVMEAPTGKWRPNQARIRSMVERNALADANGKLLKTKKDVAGRAVEIMTHLFVSPSQMPKAGGLKALGLSNDDVADFERTGSELKVVDV